MVILAIILLVVKMFNKLLQKNKVLSKIFKPNIIFLVSFIVLNIYILYATHITNENKNNYFRIHIVANSDSIQDQLLKYSIADKVDKYISKLSTNTFIDKESCKETIEKNIHSILDICYAEINSYNLDYTVYANMR